MQKGRHMLIKHGIEGIFTYFTKTDVAPFVA